MPLSTTADDFFLKYVSEAESVFVSYSNNFYQIPSFNEPTPESSFDVSAPEPANAYVGQPNVDGVSHSYVYRRFVENSPSFTDSKLSDKDLDVLITKKCNLLGKLLPDFDFLGVDPSYILPATKKDAVLSSLQILHDNYKIINNLTLLAPPDKDSKIYVSVSSLSKTYWSIYNSKEYLMLSGDFIFFEKPKPAIETLFDKPIESISIIITQMERRLAYNEILQIDLVHKLGLRSLKWTEGNEQNALICCRQLNQHLNELQVAT